VIVGGCQQCGKEGKLCDDCSRCHNHCLCGHSLFDADELGLDPETDNKPGAESRDA